MEHIGMELLVKTISKFMFSAKFNLFKKIVAGGGGGSFTPVAFVITSGNSRSVPTGATSMKAWVIGGGGGGGYDSSGCEGPADGFCGGESVRTYSVTGGAAVSYVVGAAGLGGNQQSGGPSSGTNTTLTYGGVTITGGGGGTGYGGAAGSGSGGDFNRTFNAGGTLDFQGRVAAVTLSGSSLNAGFNGVGLSSSATNGSPGGIVLYFT
jgi:hypothetical protein